MSNSIRNLATAAAVIIGVGQLADAVTFPVPSGRILHLDASDPWNNGGTTLPGDGTALTTWNDISGNNNYATAALGKEPDWLADGGAAANNLPVLDFDGIEYGDLMRTDTGIGSSDVSLFAVFRRDQQSTESGSSNRQIVTAGTATNTRISLFADKYPNAGLHWTYGGPSMDISYGSIPISNTDYHVATGVCTVSGTDEEHKTLNSQFFLDGSFRGTNNTTVGTLQGQTFFDVGGDGDNSARRFHGPIAEVIVYDRKLTVARHDEVGYHLATKYGLTNTYGVVRADIDAHQLIPTKDITAYGNDAARSSTLEMGTQGWDFTGGADQRLTIADDSSLGFVDEDFTLEFWAGPDFDNFAGKGRLLLDTRVSGTGLLVALNTNRKVVAYMRGTTDSGNKYSTGLVPNDDDLHHIAVVVDYGATAGAGNFLFYIDGKPEGTASFTGLTGSIDGNGPWTIGNHAVGVGTSWESFMGEINLFRTYACGLTDVEILESFNAGFGLPVPEPSTLVLLAVGLAGLLGYTRRRRGGK